MPKPIPPPREEGFTTSTAVPLYWVKYGQPSERDGKGPPRLLVLHGGPGADHRYMLPQMLHLGERYDLLFYDQRGAGLSKPHPPIPITRPTHDQYLSALTPP